VKRHYAVAGWCGDIPEGDGPTLNGQPITNLLADAIEEQIERGHSSASAFPVMPVHNGSSFDYPDSVGPCI
jgi:hypothetical protein